MGNINNVNIGVKIILKIAVFLIGFGLFLGNVSAATIESTNTGGDWNSINTWVGGIIPGDGDDVVINGTVIITSDTTLNGNLTINNGAVLKKNTSSSWFNFNLNGNLENNGIIGGNYHANRLYLYLNGDIHNNGNISHIDRIYIYKNIYNSENSYWRGYIYINNTDINSSRLIQTTPEFKPTLSLSGDITLIGDIDFKGTLLLNGKTLFLDGSKSLFLDTIYGGLSSKILALDGIGNGQLLNISNTSGSFETNFEDLEIFSNLGGVIGRNINLEGNIYGNSTFDRLNINGNSFITGNTILNGNIVINNNSNLNTNSSSSWIRFTINGKLENNGVFGKYNSFGNLVLTINGDFINNRIINKIGEIYLYGNLDNINGTISSNVYLKWNSLNGYSNYILNITGLNNVTINNSTHYLIPNSIKNGSNLYWKVKGKGLIFDSDWSETKCINVPGCVNISLPGEPQISTPKNLKQYIKSPLLIKEEILPGGKIGKFQSGSGIIFELETNNIDSKELKIITELNEKISGNTRIFSSNFSNVTGKRFFIIPLDAGEYTWKLRLEDNEGNASDWVEFGDNGIGTDFSIFEGFEPYPYGYSFVNSSPVSGLLTGGIKNVPNEKYYINFEKDDGYKWEIFNMLFPKNLFYSEKHMLSVFDSLGLNKLDPSIFYGGNCYGLSMISTTYKKYPLKINEISSDFYNKISPGNIYDNISLLTDDNGKWKNYDEIKTILFFQLAQKHSNYVTAENYYIKNKNPIDILNELKENPDKLYILGFGGAKNSSGKIGYHAVVPYRVEGNRIYIWDNNVPYPNYNYKNINYNAYKQYIEVYGDGKNDFKIKLYNDEAFGWNHFTDMSIVDLETIYGETENIAMGFNNNDTLYTLSGNSEIVIKDELGRISGYKDGQIYEEIPGTIFVRDYGVTLDTIDNENTWKQIYLPQKLENLSIEINGKTEENYDLMIAGGDYYTKLEGINTSSGQTDIFNISRENIKIDFDDSKTGSYNLLIDDFQNNGTGSIYIHQLEIIKEKQSFDIDWNKVTNNENDSIKYSIDTNNDLSYNQESYFNSMPKTGNETGSISGYLQGINAPGNSNMAGWKIYIDTNNDNKLQENKEIFVVTDNKGYYEFKDLEKGNYIIRIVMKPNWEQTQPTNNYFDIKLNNSQNFKDLNFEVKRKSGNNGKGNNKK